MFSTFSPIRKAISKVSEVYLIFLKLKYFFFNLQQDHRKLHFVLVIMFLTIPLVFLQFFEISETMYFSLALGIISSSIAIYFFLVIQSLHTHLKNLTIPIRQPEYNPSFNSQPYSLP